MNPTRILLKVVLIALISLCFVSCNSEDWKIKKALKEYTLNEGSKYKLTEYRIMETILKSNLEDSISGSEVSIEVNKEMMSLDSLLLNKYIAEKENCIISQRNAIYYLKSSYDDLIEGYQEWIDETEEKIKEKQDKIDSINENISEWESLINEADSPVIYYVIKHHYILDEKHKEEIVLLTTEYEVL
jgi:hypothetical protein